MRLDEIFKKGEGQHVVAFREHLWLFDSEFFEEDDAVFVDMVTVLGDHYDLDLTYMESLEDVRDEMENLSFPEALIGEIKDGNLHIKSMDDYRHSTASSTLKKVLDELNLDTVVVYGVSFDDDGNDYQIRFEHSREEFLSPLKEKVYYHGTTLDIYNLILKKGIIASSENSNYNKIRHSDTIFFTLNPDRAMAHAEIAARKKRSYPIIIILTVPDISKVVLDYDVAIDMYGSEHELTMKLGYDDIFASATSGESYRQTITRNVPKNNIEQASDKSSLNTKLGVFGYKGRVPPSHITGLMLDTNGLESYIAYSKYGHPEYSDVNTTPKDFTKFSKKDFNDFYNNIIQEFEDEIADDDL